MITNYFGDIYINILKRSFYNVIEEIGKINMDTPRGMFRNLYFLPDINKIYCSMPYKIESDKLETPPVNNIVFIGRLWGTIKTDWNKLFPHQKIEICLPNARVRHQIQEWFLENSIVYLPESELERKFNVKAG
jgi:hypothetical protein